MATGTIKTLGWKLLWTNPDPNSAFPVTGTISLDLSNYSEVAVIVRNVSDGGSHYRCYVGLVGYELMPLGMSLNKIMYREFTISESGVSSTSAGIYNSYGGSPTNDGKYNIPVYIYAR